MPFTITAMLFHLQMEKRLLQPADFASYFNSTWRIDLIKKLAMELNSETMTMDQFRQTREFVVTDLLMRNGKRAGVLADTTTNDVTVS